MWKQDYIILSCDIASVILNSRTNVNVDNRKY